MNNEIIDDLVIQLQQSRDEIKTKSLALTNNQSELEIYRDIGGIVDRIYGAISMLGNTEISAYIHTMKELCYKCSRSDNTLAYPKVHKAIDDSISHFDYLSNHLNNDEELKKAIFKINLSRKKAERIIGSYLFSVKDSSVEFEGNVSQVLVFDKSGRFEIDYKERGKTYIPVPQFYNAHAGFEKALKNKDLSVAGIIVDTSCSSNVWMEMIHVAHEARVGVPLVLVAKEVKALSKIDQRKLGVSDIVPERLGLNKVLTRVEQVRNEMEEKETLTADENKFDVSDFIEISASSFDQCASSPYDIYFRAGEKFIKILEQGNSFDHDRLEDHMRKGAEHYYIPQNQYDKYISDFSNEVKNFFNNDTNSAEEKRVRLTEFATDLYSFMEHSGVDQEKIDLSRDYIERINPLINQLVGENLSCREFVMDLVAIEHAVSAAMLGGLFLNVIGAREELFQEIVFACFFHDIGLTGSSDIMKKENISLMSEKDKERFYLHPQKGVDMLQSFNLKPAVLNAIAQHHMRMDDSGFPEFEKGKAHSINRIAELIGVVDELLLLIQKAVDEDLSYDPVEYLRPMLVLKFSPTIQRAYDEVFPPN